LRGTRPTSPPPTYLQPPGRRVVYTSAPLLLRNRDFFHSTYRLFTSLLLPSRQFLIWRIRIALFPFFLLDNFPPVFFFPFRIPSSVTRKLPSPFTDAVLFLFCLKLLPFFPPPGSYVRFQLFRNGLPFRYALILYPVFQRPSLACTDLPFGFFPPSAVPLFLTCNGAIPFPLFYFGWARAFLSSHPQRAVFELLLVGPCFSIMVSRATHWPHPLLLL